MNTRRFELVIQGLSAKWQARRTKHSDERFRCSGCRPRDWRLRLFARQLRLADRTFPGLVKFERRGHPTPVGIYPLGMTPEGICDLAGNVWEWCPDGYGEYPAEAVSNPQGSSQAGLRVIRGGRRSGKWCTDGPELRPVSRPWKKLAGKRGQENELRVTSPSESFSCPHFPASS